MQKIYFYTSPVDPSRVAITISDKTPEELIALNVFKPSTKYLIQNFDINGVDSNTRYVDRVVFDDPENPKKLVVDHEYSKGKFIDELRLQREDQFSVLDRLQMRALSHGKTDVAKSIEEDKQKLRDLPHTVDTSKFTRVFDYLSMFPAVLQIDYSEKYKRLLDE